MTHISAVQRIRAGFVSIAAAGLASCGASADSWPDGRPRIAALRFLQQSPRDPFGLQFSLQFEDGDGDLGAGRVHMSIEGREAAVRDLADVFSNQQPPLPLDVTAGEIELVVKVSDTAQVGDRVRIGFSLEDGKGERSNEPSITLEASGPGGGG